MHLGKLLHSCRIVSYLLCKGYMPTVLTSLRACAHGADMISSLEVMCLHLFDQATLQLQLKWHKSGWSLTLSLSLLSLLSLLPSHSLSLFPQVPL